MDGKPVPKPYAGSLCLTMSSPAISADGETRNKSNLDKVLNMTPETVAWNKIRQMAPITFQSSIFHASDVPVSNIPSERKMAAAINPHKPKEKLNFITFAIYFWIQEEIHI